MEDSESFHRDLELDKKDVGRLGWCRFMVPFFGTDRSAKFARIG